MCKHFYEAPAVDFIRVIPVGSAIYRAAIYRATHHKNEAIDHIPVLTT